MFTVSFLFTSKTKQKTKTVLPSQEECGLGQEESVLGQEECVLGQEECLLGQEECLLGQEQRTVLMVSDHRIMILYDQKPYLDHQELDFINENA